MNSSFPCRGQWADGVANRAFEHKGLVRVDPLRDNQTVEQALDDAIEVGAEDVTCISLEIYRGGKIDSGMI